MSCFFNTVALVKYSDFVITVDTSIVHVASTYEKKCFVYTIIGLLIESL